MEDWEIVESSFDDLGNRLEEAKKHPFHVRLDFETRYRVWRDQILPDRLMQLQKNLFFETAIRFQDLIVRDVIRLNRRAKREFLEVADCPAVPQYTLEFFQHLYIEREKLLKISYDGYMNDVIDILNNRTNWR